ncbi:MAG: glycosyl hydrolase family 18 protein, partial [Pseudomonadota bacterium]
MLALAALLASAALAGPHADALRAVQAGHLPPPRLGRPPPPPPPTDGPDAMVYGYWPYWGDDLDTVAWDQLSHIALFAVELASDGSLTHTSRWTDHASEAVEYGRRYGVKVDLCLAAFDTEVHAAVLPSPERRARLVAALAEQVDAYGADGVNLDVEGLSSTYKDDLVSLTRELRAQVGEVYLATPSIDWRGAFDYDELAAAGDGLFIMGYGYHWDGGDPGPLAPLVGGDPWSAYSLAWTVEDYRAQGAPDDKIVLGLPLYGDDWPSTGTDVPGTATADGSAVFWTSALAQAAATGRHWDAVTSTPYTFPSATHQLWYDDTESISAKVGWAVAQGLQGVGFWALTYEDGDPELWAAMAQLTARSPEDTGDSATPGDSDAPADSGPPGSPPGYRSAEGLGCGCAGGARGG